MRCASGRCPFRSIRRTSSLRSNRSSVQFYPDKIMLAYVHFGTDGSHSHRTDRRPANLFLVRDGLSPGPAFSAVGIEAGFFQRLAQMTYRGALN